MRSIFAKKTTMAVTGSLLGAFLILHLFGNLKVFFDKPGFDEYASWLRYAFHPLLPNGFLLWVFRLVMGTALVLHMWMAAQLWWRARCARGPVRARPSGWRSFSARTMPITGIAVLGFLTFHLLDLTLGQAAAPGFVETTATTSAAYANLIGSLSRPLAGSVYLATMLLLATHVSHGLWTVVNDFGITGRRCRPILAAVAALVGLVILLGNAAIPLAVWIGVLA